MEPLTERSIKFHLAGTLNHTQCEISVGMPRRAGAICAKYTGCDTANNQTYSDVQNVGTNRRTKNSENARPATEGELSVHITLSLLDVDQILLFCL